MINKINYEIKRAIKVYQLYKETLANGHQGSWSQETIVINYNREDKPAGHLHLTYHRVSSFRIDNNLKSTLTL